MADLESPVHGHRVPDLGSRTNVGTICVGDGRESEAAEASENAASVGVSRRHF